MIFKNPPADFVAEINVVACYVLYNGKFILLQRQPHKTHGGKWGLPAGKVDKDEDHVTAITREILEETGISISKDQLVRYQTLWVRNEGHDIEYHSFAVSLNAEPAICLSESEHQEHQWVTPEESLEIELVHDLNECNRLFFDLS